MIPKVIHYCWFGGNPMSAKEHMCIESWKKYCPDYKIIEWNESNYDINKNLYTQQAAATKRWAFVSDYARLDIIYQLGGIYLDTDVEILRSLDALLKHKAFAGMENDMGKEYKVATGLGFGAEPGHPVVKAWRDTYDGLCFIQPDGKANLLPTGARTTEYLISKGFKSKNIMQEIDEMVIYPTEYFAPKRYDTGKVQLTKNTFSIHHYSESWKTVEERENMLRWLRLRNRYGEKGAGIIMALCNKLRKGQD